MDNNIDVSKEYHEEIDKMYSGIINVEPHLMDENEEISEKLIESKKIRTKLNNFSERYATYNILFRMKEFNVKRVWNFPIALMAKGVRCFMMNGFTDQGNT